MDEQTAIETERVVFRGLAFAAVPLAFVVWFALPPLTLALLGGGHPSGDAIGALLALALIELFAFLGLVSAFQQLRASRNAILFAAFAANTILLVAPVVLLAAG
jgi:hypothetical protein